MKSNPNPSAKRITLDVIVVSLYILALLMLSRGFCSGFVWFFLPGSHSARPKQPRAGAR